MQRGMKPVLSIDAAQAQATFAAVSPSRSKYGSGGAKETCSTRSGSNTNPQQNGSAGVDRLPCLNEAVQVWSKSGSSWVDAVVTDYVVGRTTKLTVEYMIPNVGLARKTLLPNSVNFRRLPGACGGGSAMVAKTSTGRGGDSIAATGWAASVGFRSEDQMGPSESGGGSSPRRRPGAGATGSATGSGELPEGAWRHRPAVPDAAELAATAAAAANRSPRRERKAQALARISERGGVVEAKASSQDEDSGPPRELMDGDVLGEGRFLLHHQIGSGSFSTVRLAKDLTTGEEVALKLEPDNAKYPQLIDEARRYTQFAGGSGIPTLHWYGTDFGYNIMALELLGPSVEVAFERCDRRFALETVVRIAEQMLACVEFLHSHDYIHRDLKPNNFCLGHHGEKRSRVHVLDFGLAKRYRKPPSMGGQHIRFRGGLCFLGTVRYASLAAHLGEEQSRRDDLQALGYIFFYLLHGSLPWQGVSGGTKLERRQQVLEMKQAMTSEDLCDASPREFAQYLDYCRSLGFQDDPDYHSLHQLLASVDLPMPSPKGVGRRRRAGAGAHGGGSASPALPASPVAGGGDPLAELFDSASAVSEN